VLAGDLLGAPENFDTIEESQRADAIAILKILDRMTQPVLYVMGNDDMVELEPKRSRIRSLHSTRVELGGLSFVGYQYSLPFMGGVFEKSESGIRDDLRALDRLVDDRTVLVTHSPAVGVLDVGVMDLHAGSLSIKDLIERRSPLLHIHGHIHQEFGVCGRHFNVAAGGHKRAVLISTDTMEHQVVSE
jgi:Icc-related predicted phosphoesterase